MGANYEKIVLENILYVLDSSMLFDILGILGSESCCFGTIDVHCCYIRDKMKRITVIIPQAALIMLYQISCSVP